jgi:putative nucleotidyltransferase with HDIG domain
MLGRIIYRFKQFWFGMFSRYSSADAAFAHSYLNIQEMALFNQLPGFEKKHAVVVAKKMLESARRDKKLDERKIVRLGLLHDIGKISERNTVMTKSILVIIRFFFPQLYHRLAERGREDPKFRRYYIHKHHGEVGARLLEKIGVSSDILSTIAKHDPRVEPLGPNISPEQRILNEADSTY